MPFLTDGGGLLVSEINKLDRSYGLLSSIESIQLDDPHWQAGIEWESDCSVEASATLLPCPEALGEKSTDGGLIFCSSEPFTVYGSYMCSTGGRPAGKSLEIAANRLKRNKERAIEQIFWTGTTPVGPIDPSLQGGNASCGIFPQDLTPASGPLNTVAAIAALESSIVDCIPGGVGVIHVNPGFLPYLSSNYLVVEKNGKLHTPSGQLIIAGAGYPGSGPANVPATPGETWIFATGPVAVYNSDIFYTPSLIDQAIDRSLNNITFYAEQTFSVVWECCSFSVRVSLC